MAHRADRSENKPRLATAWATKWDGFWQYEATDDGFTQPDPTSDRAEAGTIHGIVYAVEPSKVLAFGERPFTHTRYPPPPT
jgi:hypothetical protein